MESVLELIKGSKQQMRGQEDVMNKTFACVKKVAGSKNVIVAEIKKLYLKEKSTLSLSRKKEMNKNPGKI